MVATLWRNEFQLNSTLPDNQESGDEGVVALSNGGFAVSYSSFEAGNSAIRVRLFDALGNPAGNDFSIDAGGTNFSPAVAAFSDGRLLVAWNDPATNIVGRFLDANGAPTGAVIPLSGTDFGNNASIAVFTDDSFAVIWHGFNANGDGDQGAIRVRRFDSAGQPLAAETIVNTTTAENQINPSIERLTNGGFVVAWHSFDTGDTDGSCIRYRVYDSNGSPTGADAILNTTTTGDQGSVSLTRLANGTVLAAWDSGDGGGVGGGVEIRARLFDVNGSPLASDFLINSITDGTQQGPILLALADGRFMAFWSSTGDSLAPDFADNSSGIRGRLFNADGTPDGGDIVINTTGAGGQFRPSAALLADGRITVTWQSGDFPNTDVMGQIVDPRGGDFTVVKAGISTYASDAANIVTGTAQADTIFGLDGDDTLIGLGGADVLNGGNGSDMASYGSAAQGVIVNLATGGTGGDAQGDTYISIENVIGSPHADSLAGNAQANRFDGRGGGDTLAGSGGNDTYVYNAGDTIIEQANAGTDEIIVSLASFSMQNIANVENLTGTSAGQSLTGNDVNNIITGTVGNLLHGLGGNDYITAAGNLNVAFGDAGNDQLYFTGNQNQLFGSDGADWIGVNGTNNALVGGDGDEVWIGATGNFNTLDGQGGNDQLYANGTGNNVYGSDGHDWLGCSGSANTLLGGAGVEWMGVSGTSNAAAGGEGGDTLLSVGSNILYGENGDDWVGCSGNANFLSGGAGNDYIAASGHNNTLDGGTGNDVLVAGAGHTGCLFVFKPGYGQDRIEGFLAGDAATDVIDLRGFGLTMTSLMNTYATDVGGNVVIALSGSEIVTIAGVTKAELTAGDFLLV